MTAQCRRTQCVACNGVQCNILKNSGTNHNILLYNVIHDSAMLNDNNWQYSKAKYVRYSHVTVRAVKFSSHVFVSYTFGCPGAAVFFNSNTLEAPVYRVVWCVCVGCVWVSECASGEGGSVCVLV
jgi:hypothetical protein